MKLKLMVIDALFIASFVLGVYAVGNEAYKAFLAPTEKIVTAYTVQVGDTWYGICDKHYIIEDNVDCFNENWYRNMNNNGNRNLKPGDVVTIVNEVYK